ncbi:MAG TPA: tripartite tricarboxylate transporter substrate binding protein [Burkholderiales bacterium]|nr:tripartite tricarboxylate transporter substrate binding protein [Burkholderiales bacterium]
MKSFILGLVLALAVPSAIGQSFPAKPIRFLVPFGPGGIGDITARVVAQKMSDQMGQQIIIDNRPGAGGVVATEIVAKSEPDGHTMLLLNNAHAISTSLFKSLPYDTLRDFAPVGGVGTFSIVVLVSPESPLKSVKDLIAQAKANPGKLNAGTVLVGATQHLSAELFKSMAGVDFTAVPHSTTGALLTSLRGGSVQVAFEFMAPVVGQLRSGALRGLAVSSRNRFSGLSNIPTVAESGAPGYEVTSWNGIGVPAKTPRAVIARLEKEINIALANPDLKQRFHEMGMDTFPIGPDAFRKHIAAEIAKWKAVIETAKIPRQ